MIQKIDSEPHLLTSAKDLELICGKFLSGLKQSSRKLIVVLDQLDRINSGLATEFRDHILLKLAADNSSNVRLVLVMNETHYKEWGLEAIGHPGIREVRLPADQTPEELLDLALEACRLGPLSTGREQRKKELIGQCVKEFLEEPDRTVGLGRLNFLPKVMELFRLNPARMR